MADEPEQSGQEPNLELPSLLSFARNRKRRKGEPALAEGDTASIPAGEPASEAPAPAEADSPTAEPLAAEPVLPPSGQPARPRGGLAPSTGRAKRLPPVPAPTGRAEVPTQQIPVPPPPPRSDQPPEVEERPAVTAPEVAERPPEVTPPERDEPPVIVSLPEAEVAPVVSSPEAATDLPVKNPSDRLGDHPGPDFIEPEPVRARAQPESPAAVPVDESLGWPVEQPTEQRARRGRTSLALPAVNARLACVVTGALVGLLGVLLTHLAGRGCEAVRGVGSCGGVGLLALLLIVAVQVVLGAVLLKAWQISDSTSTSFLGVGLVAVFVLLFLLSSLESVSMLLVIPVLSGLSFLFSWWVTTSLVEVPGEEARR